MPWAWSFYVSFEHSEIETKPMVAPVAVVGVAFRAPILFVTLSVSEPKSASQQHLQKQLVEPRAAPGMSQNRWGMA